MNTDVPAGHTQPEGDTSRYAFAELLKHCFMFRAPLQYSVAGAVRQGTQVFQISLEKTQHFVEKLRRR